MVNYVAGNRGLFASLIPLINEPSSQSRLLFFRHPFHVGINQRLRNNEASSSTWGIFHVEHSVLGFVVALCPILFAPDQAFGNGGSHFRYSCPFPRIFRWQFRSTARHSPTLAELRAVSSTGARSGRRLRRPAGRWSSRRTRSIGRPAAGRCPPGGPCGAGGCSAPAAPQAAARWVGRCCR